ncbi:MAG: CvpA family protein [Treponema sp.]|nr:CvpA family protein [Treponema sp.]
MNASVLDLVFVVILMACAMLAALHGFVREVLEKGAPVVSIWAALLLYRQVLVFIEPSVPIHVLAVAISFFLVFIVVYVLLMIVRSIMVRIVNNEILRGLDRFLGFCFGLVEGLAIVVVVLVVLKIQPWFDVQDLLGQSLSYHLLEPLVSIPVQGLRKAASGAHAIRIQVPVLEESAGAAIGGGAR